MLNNNVFLMNLLPQRQSQTIKMTVFQFCLQDLSCLSWPASGRSISENCLQDHDWALSPTHGRKANSYLSSTKLEDLEIHGVSSGCWPTPCLQASLSGSPHTQAVAEAVVDRFEAAQPGGLPVSKPEKCRFRKIWRWIRSDKEVTLVPADHPHPISKLKQAQDRKALSLKRFCLQH